MYTSYTTYQWPMQSVGWYDDQTAHEMEKQKFQSILDHYQVLPDFSLPTFIFLLFLPFTLLLPSKNYLLLLAPYLS